MAVKLRGFKDSPGQDSTHPGNNIPAQKAVKQTKPVKPIKVNKDIKDNKANKHIKAIKPIIPPSTPGKPQGRPALWDKKNMVQVRWYVNREIMNKLKVRVIQKNTTQQDLLSNILNEALK